jgi:hypothetical protein
MASLTKCDELVPVGGVSKQRAVVDCGAAENCVPRGWLKATGGSFKLAKTRPVVFKNMGGSVVAKHTVRLTTRLVSGCNELVYYVLESRAVRPPIIGSSTLEALGVTVQFTQKNNNITSSNGEKGTLQKVDGVWTTDVFVDHAKNHAQVQAAQKDKTAEQPRAPAAAEQLRAPATASQRNGVKYSNGGPERRVKKSACATTTHERQQADGLSSCSEAPPQIAVSNAGHLQYASEGEGREGIWLVRARRGVRPASW